MGVFQQVGRRSLVLLFFIVLSACGGGGGGSASPPAGSPPGPSPPPPPTPPARFALSADIQYGVGPTSGGGIPLFLDLYAPVQPCTSPRPAVVFVHGGGFTSGSRKGGNVVAIADELVPLGNNLISIQYRLQGDLPTISPEFSSFESDFQAIAIGQPASRITAFVAAVEDTVRALRWIASNANQYCLDANRIGVWGSSAGAYTVLHVAYSLDLHGIARPAPRVVVDYWGGLFRDSDLQATEAPLFIMHGTADATVPYSEATQITQQAQSVGVPFTFYSITGGGHDFGGSGFFELTVNGQSIAKRTADFVDAHLRGGTPLYERRDIPR